MNLELPNLRRTARPGDITIKHIKAFLAAIEYKSLSRAAQHVFQSQPAFSRCIQELESELGDDVFIRTPQGVALSEFGAAFFPYAQKLLACHFETQTAMIKWRATRQTKLILAGCASVMHSALPYLLKSLSSEFANPSLQFEAMSSAQVIDRVLSGRAALGVCTLTREQPDLFATHVLEAPLGLLVAPDCRLPDTITNLSELKNLAIVRFTDDSVVSETLRSHGIALEPYFDSQIESCGVPGSFSLVRLGKMVMIATGFGASHPMAADLRFIPLPGLLPSIEVSIISLADARFNTPVQIMKELVQASILATPWHASVQRPERNKAPKTAKLTKPL